MHKTTIYLNKAELKELRLRAARMGERSVAQLIRQSIRDFIRKKEQKNKFDFLRKKLHQKPSRTSFGDPVAFQRSLRGEWK